MRRLLTIFAVAALTVALTPACKGPVGPVIQVAVGVASDPQVLSEIHGLSVVVRSGGDSEIVEFPEGGPAASPLDLPGDFALIASEVTGTLAIEVTGLARRAGGEATPVAFGFAEVSLNEEELYRTSVALGVDSGCGLPAPPETVVPRLCLRRDDMELVLGHGDAALGNINNGVELQDLDGNRIPDLLAAWSENRNDESHKSGVSVFFGFEVAERGVVFAEEKVFEDKGDGGARRSNTEAIGVDLVGEGGGPADGKLDIVASSLGTKGLTIRPKLARQDFDLPLFFDLGKRPGEMQAADLLADEPGQELVVALRDDAALLVVLPANDERGLTTQEIPGLQTGPGLRGLHVADLDSTQGLDIVSAAKGEPDAQAKGAITVHLSQADGTFVASAISEPDFGWHDVRAADLNEDGAADVAAVNVDRGVVGIFIGAGDGSFTPGLEYTLTGSDGVQQRPDRVRLGDFDGDGKVDILACAVGKSGLHLLLLNDQGRPRFPVIRIPGGELEGEAGEDLQGCAIADTTGDGRIDRLAITDRLENRVRVLVSEP